MMRYAIDDFGTLLAAAQPIDFIDEDDAVAQLRPGVDGVILTHANLRSTFLPQVWETLPDARRFLGQLKQKAGLPADFWDARMQLARYTVQKWKES